MIEIRMLHRSHDEYHGEHGYPTKFTEDILQYRQKISLAPYQLQANGISGLGQQIQPCWSEWTDVADVYESEDDPQEVG